MIDHGSDTIEKLLALCRRVLTPAQLLEQYSEHRLSFADSLLSAAHDLPIINTEAPSPDPCITASNSARDIPKAPRKQAAAFEIPAQLVKPGVEMLKVSAKSARRVKPRKLWLEVGGETPDDGELGLEVGVGVVGGQDVRLCWEKGGTGIGANPELGYARTRL